MSYIHDTNMWLLVLYFTGVLGLLDNVGLTDLSIERRVQTMMDELLRLEKEVADLKQSNAALTQSNTVLTQSNTALTSAVATLKSKDESIAFLVYLVKDMVNPSTGQTVIFSGVDTNVGNAYDPVHGVFVAPISGTYQFTVVASAPSGTNQHGIHLFLKKNDGSNKMYLFLDRNTEYWIQRAASSVLHLSKGERVWVQVGFTAGPNTIGGYGASDDARYTHFSGFLIHAD